MPDNGWIASHPIPPERARFSSLDYVDQESKKIIFDFFDLLSAIAAHGKMNGFGGRKLSRMAAWWTFEQKDTENGFEGGYKAWLRYVAPAPTNIAPV